jgi:hypothetical protein
MPMACGRPAGSDASRDRAALTFAFGRVQFRFRTMTGDAIVAAMHMRILFQDVLSIERVRASTMLLVGK